MHKPKVGMTHRTVGRPLKNVPELEVPEYDQFMLSDQHVSFMPLAEEFDVIVNQMETEYHSDDLCARLNESQYFNRRDERNHHARALD